MTKPVPSIKVGRIRRSKNAADTMQLNTMEIDDANPFATLSNDIEQYE